MKRIQLLLFFFSIIIASCNEKPAGGISFYYWKTNFSLSQYELNTLGSNHAEKLYIRYFDIDKKPGETEAMPVAPVVLDSFAKKYNIVPVIFIKKRVFENVDSHHLPQLAKNVHSLIQQISQSQEINNSEIQFDCDWTDKTKELYFSFLREYRELSKKVISATIRLHQVKYFNRTGIPPVDKGVLMYYNMGEINAGTINSIYDKATAAKYNTSLAGYPLLLDIALPIFSWGQLLRDGKVVQLLNKINDTHFNRDSNFIYNNNNQFLVKQSCFKAGYYFIKNDIVKLETIKQADLFNMADDIKKYSKKSFQHIIFYDLDSINLSHYEMDIYQKILDKLY
ncbi:MAG: hypothetical protein QM791_11600 [Ferruginibacter sp.]